MKINFPRIIRPVDLGEYAPEMKEQRIFVWVNPPTGDLAAMLDSYKLSLVGEQAEKETAAKAYIESLSVLLSQGEKDSHVSPAELQELRDGTRETDPAFWVWLMARVMDEINGHRRGLKKV
jgi:hypothetical protein